jgi:hypothetical protein
MRQWTVEFHKIRWISWVAEDLLAAQDGPCFVDLAVITGFSTYNFVQVVASLDLTPFCITVQWSVPFEQCHARTIVCCFLCFVPNLLWRNKDGLSFQKHQPKCKCYKRGCTEQKQAIITTAQSVLKTVFESSGWSCDAFALYFNEKANRPLT